MVTKIEAGPQVPTNTNDPMIMKALMELFFFFLEQGWEKTVGADGKMWC